MKSNAMASTLYCKRGHQRTAATVLGPTLSGCRQCDKITRHARYQTSGNKEKLKMSSRQYELKKKYGLSLEAYNLLFVEQYGKCKICYRHQSELNRRLDIDHDHKTGKVRGLLCLRCNQLVGHIENNTSLILRRAKEYIHAFTI